MEVVKVSYDKKKEYLYKTKRKLYRGDVVLVLNSDKDAQVAVCTCDSRDLPPETLDWFCGCAGWTVPLMPVIGKMERWSV